jgi:hypothetical protein
MRARCFAPSVRRRTPLSMTCAPCVQHVFRRMAQTLFFRSARRGRELQKNRRLRRVAHTSRFVGCVRSRQSVHGQKQHVAQVVEPKTGERPLIGRSHQPSFHRRMAQTLLFRSASHGRSIRRTADPQGLRQPARSSSLEIQERIYPLALPRWGSQETIVSPGEKQEAKAGTQCYEIECTK